MSESTRPRIVGLNHIALEVGDIDEALAFYGRIFQFELRGKSDAMAFIDLAINSSPSRRGGNRVQMVAAISVSSSMTRKQLGAPSTQPA
jgi:predicted enzyme related to lactoylglutathione lyase